MEANMTARLRRLIEPDVESHEAPLTFPAPTGWRARRDGESEQQRVDRVGRSCCHCGSEFDRTGSDLDRHEDQH